MERRSIWSNFFPRRVYRCACLGEILEKCFEKKKLSFLQIHDEVFTFVLEHGLYRVFTAKCGDNLKDLIMSCEKCSSVMVYAQKKFDCTASADFETLRLQLDPEDPEKNFCKYCVKKYLRKSIKYFYYYKFNN